MVGLVRRRWVIGWMLGAGLAIAWGIWRWGPPDPIRPAPGQTVAVAPSSADDIQAFVGSAACSECHPRIAAEYASHPMAQSMARIGPGQTVEDYRERTRFEAGRGLQYWVERREDGVIHHEAGLDHDGQVVFDQGVEVQYAMGSGRRGRSYVTDRDGLLFMSPISWYSEKNCWDLSPGYVPNQHPRFARRASDRCLQCHAGQMSYVASSPGADFEVYRQPPFAELTIGCERCHGPGRAHIEWRRAAGAPGGPDPIINPARLSASHRDDVCNQCHLQGEFQVLRYGKAHADFRPGNLVADIWTVFTAGARIDEQGGTEAVSQVEQMRSSRCFTASRGQLGCTTCHDPHSLPAEAERITYFDQRCRTCHQPEHCPQANGADPRQGDPTGRSCVGCHMPRLSANDVPHTTQTDHRIRRRPGLVADAHGPKERNDRALPQIYELSESGLTPEEVSLAHGLYLIERAKTELDRELAVEAETLLKAAATHWPDDPRIMDGLAFCSVLAGRSGEATGYWLRALELSASNAEIAHSLAVQMMKHGEMTRAHELVRRSLELDPWRDEMHRNHSRLLLARGELPAAIAAAQRALELNPSDPQSHRWIAELHRLHGDLESSRQEMSRAERIESGRRAR